MKGPCCAICKVGSINCDGNGWNPFKNSLTCCWITSTASSTTAAPRYASEWWKPSTATSKPFFEGAAATRISAICCSRPNAWRSQKQNSSFSRKQPKMRGSTNSCAEPEVPNSDWTLSEFCSAGGFQLFVPGQEVSPLFVYVELSVSAALSFSRRARDVRFDLG